MKLSFEGRTIHDIVRQMEDMLTAISLRKPPTGETILTATAPVAPKVTLTATSPIVPKDTVQEDSPTTAAGRAALARAEAEVAAMAAAVDKPVHKPVEKRARTEKQLANDEKMRVAALERIAAKRAAKAVQKPVEEPVEKAVEKPVEEPFAEPEEVDPAEIVRIRQKTIEELQAAYANGHQKEVFELLSRFGNGAKSFRELPPESFVPIRQAIDLGALE